MEYDLIVIGGGAAGLMAAGTAASAGAKVALLEKMEKPARKIRITGKGRCNLTNIRPAEEFLAKVQTNREFFVPAYAEFDNRALVKFFERLGVRLSTEQGGRVFPKSGKAWDVAEALVEWCREAGVEIICHAAVCEILLLGSRVRGVNYKTKRDSSDGRKPRPSYSVREAPPTLPQVPRATDTLWPMPSGIPSNPSGRRSSRWRPPCPTGSFCTDCICETYPPNFFWTERPSQRSSGRCPFRRAAQRAVVLRMSRTAVDALIEGHRVELSVDLKPALDEATLRERIGRETGELGPEAPMADLLRRLVPKELVMPIAKAVGGHPKRLLRQAAPEMAETLIRTLKDFRIPVSDYRPFEEAIVTAGGITVSEVNPATMESRLVRGLYFAGEVLDLDANTGGYNLQMAFSTGRLAGRLKHEE